MYIYICIYTNMYDRYFADIISISQAQKDVAAWMAEPTWRASPRDASFESWAQRAGAQLIAYGTPASHVPSVVPLGQPAPLGDFAVGNGDFTMISP